MEVINEYIELIIVVLIAALVIQTIVIAKLGRKVNRLRASYETMMNGAGVENLEQVILGIRQELQEQQAGIKDAAVKINEIEQRLPLQKNKLALTRYNAFADSGSDLSFSLAIVDDHKNGVVLTSIHSREGMYVYGKPLQKGQSNYSLTPEERKVIEVAE